MSTSNATAFSELQTMTLEVFKRTDKTTELKRAINDAVKEMVACINPRKLQDQIYKTVTAGREEYAIPDTILRINHPIRLIDPTADSNAASSYPLQHMTKNEYDAIEPNPNAGTVRRGKPWGYCFYKNSILLTDIPDRGYTLEMNVGGEATVMSAASDATVFAPTWDETIKAGALARLYAGIRFWDEADRWQTIYRWGFAGNEKNIMGGLEMLRKLNDQMIRAPLIMPPRDF